MDEEKRKKILCEELNTLRTYQKLERTKMSITINELISYCEQCKSVDMLLVPYEERPIGPKRQRTCYVNIFFGGCFTGLCGCAK